jgi:hypothetical protein
MARFEPSALPQYTGRRVLHLRILKILRPVNCTVDSANYSGRVVEPKEGELFTVRNRVGVREPWAYDIDARKTTIAAGLRALWDIPQTV